MFVKVCTSFLAVKQPIKSLRKQSGLSYLHKVGQEPLKPLTLGLLLEQTVQNHGENLAVISRHQGKRMTYLQVLQQADRLAAGLIKSGHQKGDRVGLWAPNMLEWYITNMACARAGLIMVAINPSYRPREIEYCIKKVGIKGIICGHKFKNQDYYELLKMISPELSNSEPGKLKCKNLPSLKNVVTIADESLRGTYNYNDILDLADEESVKLIKSNQDSIKIDDPYNIQFTSGTTGHPKAVVISHFQLTNNGFFVGQRNELDKKHQTICVQVPLFHAFGIVITIGASVNNASTLVLPSPEYNPNKNLDALRDERCTVIHGTPTMYVDLVNVQKKKERKKYLQKLQFLEVPLLATSVQGNSVYGMSETTAVAFQSMPNDDENTSVTTVGHLQEHLEAKVVDDNDRIVPLGTPGELCIRGYISMLEYWEDQEKTKEILGSDKWLRTGDQVVLDENGYCRIVGRLKEMIIRGGENIFPKEIEDFLNTHPNIIETHVIGLPNERLGEEVCACVRVKENCTLTLEELRSFCQGQIASFKIPSALEIIESFPVTTSGKIQKFKLIEKVLSGKSKK
ncbi:hypothetical protein NQ318_010565 [Aromia moschata]|uniref:Medium-chain acyl-CoA ligase ACSF2, mitochondrial n=1 Tax=Aromia moschata TaxID=1265417 RepID=A0AAV8XCE8_9CUCU|nr:hypothetical protein NQ318_010565 [Aromia moschata]